MFDKKLKKLRYLLSELKYWLKIRVGPFNEQRTTDPGSRLIDPVDVEEDRPQTDPPTWQCDLNKWKNINTHPIDWSSLYLLTLHWLGNRINYQWSQITFLLSIRLTGAEINDFKELD